MLQGGGREATGWDVGQTGPFVVCLFVSCMAHFIIKNDPVPMAGGAVQDAPLASDLGPAASSVSVVMVITLLSWASLWGLNGLICLRGHLA